MNHIINAFKNLPRRGQHNFVKILCLSLGLAISSVIIAEIYFEQTYDTYFPGWERTYQISEVGSMPSFNGSKPFSFNQTSGAIAPGVKDYAPMVEAATRFVDMDKELSRVIGRSEKPVIELGAGVIIGPPRGDDVHRLATGRARTHHLEEMPRVTTGKM